MYSQAHEERLWVLANILGISGAQMDIRTTKPYQTNISMAMWMLWKWRLTSGRKILWTYRIYHKTGDTSLAEPGVRCTPRRIRSQWGAGGSASRNPWCERQDCIFMSVHPS
jgi:hypothetical protein